MKNREIKMKDELIAKIEAREAVVGVIGLGYVGLPLAREFLKKNFTVMGFDVDDDKIIIDTRNALKQKGIKINKVWKA